MLRVMGIRCGIGMAAFSLEEPRAYFRLVVACEEAGIDSFWQTDRLVGGEPQLEAMAAMASLAGATERIKFGMNAVVIGYRDPLVLAKQCATIDFLSGGRLLPVFGVGFDGDPTWKATGRDPAGRGRRANEALTLLARLWSEESVDFEGEFYQYRGAHVEPRPVQQPLPLWIGGASKAAIRRTAAVGTGWLGGLMPVDQVGPVIRAIRDAANEAGRPVDDDHYGATIPFHLGDDEPPGLSRFTGSRARAAGIADPAQMIALGDATVLIDRIRCYAEAGASKFVLLPLATGEAAISEQVRRLSAEVLPVVEAPGFLASAQVAR
jgi:probable F420-dependent oxidoreductase